MTDFKNRRYQGIKSLTFHKALYIENQAIIGFRYDGNLRVKEWDKVGQGLRGPRCIRVQSTRLVAAFVRKNGIAICHLQRFFGRLGKKDWQNRCMGLERNQSRVDEPGNRLSHR